MAKANFPGFEVLDRMETTRGVPSVDTWLGGVSFALKQLAALKRGDVRLEGLGMWISGEAEDVAAYRAVKSALANNLPKGIKLTRRPRDAAGGEPLHLGGADWRTAGWCCRDTCRARPPAPSCWLPPRQA